MSKLWRALLVSAVATGAAAVALKLIETKPPAPSSPPAPPPEVDGPYVDADRMTKEQQDLLLRELDAQL